MNDSSLNPLFPGDELAEHIRGFWISQLVHAFARLGVADRFSSGSRTGWERERITPAQAERVSLIEARRR